MNLKANLTYLSILMGLVLFSNQMGYAQIETAVLFHTDANRTIEEDILKLSDKNINQLDLCFGLTDKQTLQKPYFKTMYEMSGFKEISNNYFAKEIERNTINENIKVASAKFYILPFLFNHSVEYNSLNQDPGKHVETKEFCLHRAKNQNTAAWILLGGGTVMTIIGLAGFSANFDVWGGNNAQNTRTDIFGFMILTGIVADLVSIPLFISSHHNKKIASIISFGNQKNYSPYINSYSMNPTLALKVNF